MIFNGIILTCISNLNGERTASSIYHLLKGKKSIQTVQDAHIYQLDKFYGIHSNLNKQKFAVKISELVTGGYIQPVEHTEGAFIISDFAATWLYEQKKQLGIEKFNGLKYNETAELFYLRLLLTVQTLTNVKMGHYHFIPLTDNSSAEEWVRLFYKKIKRKESQVLNGLYQEIHTVLNNFSDMDASIFVDRLSGFENYGLSIYQLSEKYKLNELDVHLVLQQGIHQMISIVLNDKDFFPILAYMLRDIAEPNQITHSANVTKEFLNKNYTIEQIAAARNLKINTIHDHIVEIALYESRFPLSNYITPEEQREITTVLKKEKSFKLKDIKQSVNKNVSYFQIRLVLAVNKNLLKQGD
ncbi:helix-turn-helix domain-containing protein [Oceanobacillus damuensis]|uniref:helix-turn-helix domain-containing protein n=1 Tax=Oceanobacillus damuensis TaxID=937928 RepID=UPI000829ECEC|nr:helix-turn-helix domain-containing protein [Oceanobacillus damuensis]